MRRIADLLDHPVQIVFNCACSSIRTAVPLWFIRQFGDDVTVEEAERRLRCEKCGERARLSFALAWGARLSVETRGLVLDLPEWVVLEG